MGFDLFAYSDINDHYSDGEECNYSAHLHAFYSDPNLHTYIELLDLEEGYTSLPKLKRALNEITEDMFQIMRVNIIVKRDSDRENFEWTEISYHFNKFKNFLETLIKNTESKQTKISVEFD